MGRSETRHLASSTPLAVTVVAAITAIAFSLALGLAGQAHAVQDSTQDAPRLIAAQADEDGVIDADSEKLEASKQPAPKSVRVTALANVQGKGWLKKWAKSGKTAGTISRKGLRAVRIKLDGVNPSITGSIRYKTYDKGKGWGKTKANGESSGRTGRSVQAVKIWLKGDIANHYDVLYRVYIKGKGWQPWVKNKAKAGITKPGVYATALQVMLSPKTAEAVGNTDEPSVRYEARLKGSGWQKWKKSGATAGKASKKSALDGFVMSVNDAEIGGGIRYRAYIEGMQWSQGWKDAGRTVGVAGKRLEALQIKLTGELADECDIYYRSYVAGYGWLDWTANGSTSGSTGLSTAISAVQVRLVPDGEDGPEVGENATADSMRETLDGIDISSWQSKLKIANVPADFVIVKATGGKGYTNPYFSAQAYATVKSGKLLGLYHYARESSCPGTAKEEADHFVKAVGSYIGRAVLVLDWEGDALLLGTKWAKKFLDRVYKKTGVRPLIYMSKNPTRDWNWKSVAKKYKLWVAQYPNYNPTGYQSDPWTDDKGYGAWDAPTIFQYASTGRLSGYSGYLDLDIFYGTKDDWKKLAAKSKKA